MAKMKDSTKPGTKRHTRKARKDGIDQVSAQGIRRMAHRGGVKRMSGLVYARTRATMQTFLANLVRDTLEVTRHAKRKTVFLGDVHRALALNGRRLYYC
jgi:histone H4